MKVDVLLYLTAAQPDSMHRSKVDMNLRWYIMKMQNKVQRFPELDLNHMLLQSAHLRVFTWWWLSVTWLVSTLLTVFTQYLSVLPGPVSPHHWQWPNIRNGTSHREVRWSLLCMMRWWKLQLQWWILVIPDNMTWSGITSHMSPLATRPPLVLPGPSAPVYAPAPGCSGLTWGEGGASYHWIWSAASCECDIRGFYFIILNQLETE